MAGAAAVQSADQSRFHARDALGWFGGWGAVLALAAWTQQLAPTWLTVAAAGALLWSVAGAHRRGWWQLGAVAALWLAVGVGAGVQLRLHRISTQWPAVRLAAEERAADALRRSLDDLVDRGEDAVNGAAEIMDAGRVSGTATFTLLDALWRRAGVSALAVYGPEDTPLAWAGAHRGMIPDAVRRGERDYAFVDGPLFGYLYFTRDLGGGHTAVAATLLNASVRVGDEATPFDTAFAERHGVTPRFTRPERAQGGAVWDWSTDRPILSVSFTALTQARWRERIAHQGRWGAIAALFLGVVLLTGGWYRRSADRPGVPVVVSTIALLLIPWSALTDAGGLFSPLRFVLPLPGDISLGELLILLTGGAVWLLTRDPPEGIGARLPLLARVGLAALAVPVCLRLVRDATEGGSLAAQTTSGVALQLATTLLLAVPLYLLLLPGRSGSHPERPVWAAVPAGLLAALLSAMLLVVWQPTRGFPAWLPAFWAVPFAWFAASMRRPRSGRSTLYAWLAAGWLAGTAALPALWSQHVDARLEDAERDLAHLGTEVDPFLDFLLRQFADHVLYLAAEGEQGVNLLYRSWVSSGLAREGYEARVTTWTADKTTAELRLSDAAVPPRMIPDMLMAARAAEEPLLEHYTQLDAVHYLLLVPLPGGRVVSVAVPPRRRLGRATALARFLDPDPDATRRGDAESLSLIPVSVGETSSSFSGNADTASVHWLRTGAGWRSEARVAFPAGPMHAHLIVRTPSGPMLVVRAVLLQTFLLAVMALLWAASRTLNGEPLGFSASRWRWLRSFRGRLTLALLTFFLVPTLAFGAVAYGTLSREVARTAEAVAHWSLERAAPLVATEPLPVAGRAVGADLLLYRRGTLVDAAAPEVLDLGLFHTWLPPHVFFTFRGGEDLAAVEEQRLAGNRYLVAYRRLQENEVLAVPTPLASGEIARRQRELAHVVLLISLAGAGLSVVLSLLVGRALSRPIEKLSRAAAAVGGGNLRVRLPEGRQDEFGGLYRSFNRMVRRLRHARASEVRAARVLAWGEMARQVAHEIKNPLTPIKLSVQHLRRAYADRRPDFAGILDRNVEAVLREIDRLGEIARAFARFGSPASVATDLEPVDVRGVVEETLALYRGTSDGIIYHAEVLPDVPPVLARVGEFKEVLVNLLENSRQAMDGTGEIRIAAEVAGGGGRVRLDVSDTGEGIPAELLPRIFEPQFSTRSSGTGLGLAIVRRLVESWGGEIAVESLPGTGTTFQLRLRTAELNDFTDRAETDGAPRLK